MRIKRIFELSGFLLIVLTVSRSAIACACCAEPGSYDVWTGKPEAHTLDVLGDIKFSKTAELYMTAAEFEGLKGLESLRKEYESDTWVAEAGEFDLAVSFTGRLWRLSFKSRGGQTGILVLPTPVQMSIYKADIHDGKQAGGGGPLLYKEYIFKGRVTSAAGFFRPGTVRPAQYTLVFQGRGNSCDNASDFTHWRFEVTGPKADYAFFGGLASQ